MAGLGTPEDIEARAAKQRSDKERNKLVDQAREKIRRGFAITANSAIGNDLKPQSLVPTKVRTDVASGCLASA